MAAFTPRIMIVDSLSTFLSEGTQNLGLSLLDRTASTDFYKQFNEGSPAQVAKVLEYAREHAIACLGRSGASFNHRRNHQVKGTGYHLGDIVTEQAAYDFGYVEPHIDTVAGRIAEAGYQVKSQDEFVATLRGLELINNDQTVICKSGQIDVISNERLMDFSYGPKVRGPNCASHPVTLYVFPVKKDGVMPVGVGYFVPEKNCIFEFMTYVPIK